MASPRDRIQEITDFKPGLDVRKNETETGDPSLFRFENCRIEHDGSVVPRPPFSPILQHPTGVRHLLHQWHIDIVDADAADNREVWTCDNAGFHTFAHMVPPELDDPDNTFTFGSDLQHYPTQQVFFRQDTERFADSARGVYRNRQGSITISSAWKTESVNTAALYQRETDTAAQFLTSCGVDDVSTDGTWAGRASSNHLQSAASFGGVLYLCDGYYRAHKGNVYKLSTGYPTSGGQSADTILPLRLQRLHDPDEVVVPVGGGTNYRPGWSDDFDNPTGDIQERGGQTTLDQPEGSFPACDFIYSTSLGTSEYMFAVRGSRIYYSFPLSWRRSSHWEENTHISPALRTKQRLFGAEDWRAEDFIDIDTGSGDDIVALTRYKDHLLVLKRKSVWAIYGSPDDEGFQVLKVSGDVGGLSPKAVLNTPYGVFFYSVPEGVMLYGGDTSIRRVGDPIGRQLYRTDYEAAQVALGYDNGRLYVSVLNVSTPDSTNGGRWVTYVYDFEVEAWYRWWFHAGCWFPYEGNTGGTQTCFVLSARQSRFRLFTPGSAIFNYPSVCVLSNDNAISLVDTVLDKANGIFIADESGSPRNFTQRSTLLFSPSLVAGAFRGEHIDEVPIWREARLDLEYRRFTAGALSAISATTPVVTAEVRTDAAGLNVTSEQEQFSVLGEELLGGVILSPLTNRARLFYVEVSFAHADIRLVNLAVVSWQGNRLPTWGS